MKCSILLALLVCAGIAPGQSLWDSKAPQPSLFADTTARYVGDILTVIISESQKVKNKEDTNYSKELELDAKLENWDVIENMFGILPAARGRIDRSMTGTAKYDKEGSLESRLSVVVIDVMPNGTLLIEGRRRVIMDRETKSMRLVGLVRPYDITGENTVLSWKVANASISYEGSGPLTRTIGTPGRTTEPSGTASISSPLGNARSDSRNSPSKTAGKLTSSIPSHARSSSVKRASSRSEIASWTPAAIANDPPNGARRKESWKNPSSSRAARSRNRAWAMASW